jgi:hypothetical protein
MANVLSNETETIKALPITARKFVKLRRKGQIPFMQVDRFTRLYDLAKVVSALERLEVKTKGKTKSTVAAK